MPDYARNAKPSAALSAKPDTRAKGAADMGSYWDSVPPVVTYPKPAPDYALGTIRGPFRGSPGSP